MSGARGLAARHALVLVLAIAAGIPYGWRAVGSLALGGGVQIVNLRALERSVAGMLGLAASGQRGAATALLQLRLVVFLGAVAVILVATPVAPLAFAVGLLTTVPAVVWHGIASARAARES